MAQDGTFFIASNATQDLVDFSNHTLVIPTVSHASVPQLAVDLLLHSKDLSLDKIGCLDTSGDLVPFVGEAEDRNQSAGTIGLSTPLEVYSSPSHNLTFLQQRSPVFQSRKRAFVRKLSRWIKHQRFTQVLILSSVDASLRFDGEMQTTVTHALPAAGDLTPLLRSLQSRFPVFEGVNEQTKPGVAESHSSSHSKRLPSSTGLAGQLLTSLSDAETAAVPVGALLLFAAEGDNRQDAQHFASVAFELLSSGRDGRSGDTNTPHQFVEPRSWRGVYGNAYDQSVYG